MPSFQKLFIESKGKPVEYNGRVIRMSDSLPITDGQTLRITFEAVNSDWRQGIYISTNGTLDVNGQIIPKAITIWNDTAPNEVTIRINTKSGECRIKNVWDIGDGVMHSGHNGAAMIVEEFPSGRRYKCNDGRANDDFNDLVFRIELIKELS